MKDIKPAIENALKYSDIVIVEEFIQGKEVTWPSRRKILEVNKYVHHFSYRNKKIEGFEFFSYDAKYSGVTSEVCPGNFSEKNNIQKMAVNAHRV